MFFYLVTPLILIASSSLGLLINPSWSVSPFIWVFILVPIIDLVLPYLSKQDADLKENVLHNFFILIILPCILFLIIFGLIIVSDSSISIMVAAALGAAVGMSGGSIGITTAHELIHRQNKYMRGIGVLLLVLCCYGHFRIEHVYGHHKHVATKEDPALQAWFRKGMLEIGAKICSEWAKDDYHRLINSQHLLNWSDALRRSVAQGQEVWLLAEINQDVDALLNASVTAFSIEQKRYFATKGDIDEPHDEFDF